MSEWKETILGNLVKFGNGKTRPKEDGDIPIYGGNGILGFTNQSNYQGDVIIVGRVGAYCGSVYYSKGLAWVSDNALAVLPKNGYSTKYLYYFLKNLDLNNYAEGSSHPLVTQSLLNSIEVISTLNIETQERFAEVLSSLDDKIDLLLKQNQTLEQLAETMFRQWFVEEAEESWITSTVGESFDIKGGGTPPTGEKSYWDGKICWTSPRDLSSTSNIFLHNTERKITEAGLRKVSSGLLPKGVVLLSSRAPIGYIAITDVTTAINQGYIACLPNELYSSWFIHNWLKVSMDLIVNSANGSTFLEIPKSVFRTLNFVVPPREKVVSYNHQAELLYNKILSNEKQINLLEQTRDTLLPKLMSGAVRVVSS